MDHRDFAHIGLHKYIAEVSKSDMTLVLEDLDGNQVRFKFRYDVCPTCKGKGVHVNPNIDRHGITGDEMRELGPDFRRDYLNGRYDQPCNRCEGDKVMPQIDRSYLNEAQEQMLRRLEENLQVERETDMIQEMERRFGC